MTGKADIRTALLALDTRGWNAVEDARENLLPLGRAIFPAALQVFADIRGYQGRTALMHTALKFALVCPEAVDLALMGLNDRSGHVRSKACLLLAVAGDARAVPALMALRTHKDPITQADALAAITAIRTGNPNRFRDRDNSGKVTISIGGLIQPEG